LGHFAGHHGGTVVMDRFMAFLAFTTFANMAGLPSMSVPLEWNQVGLPIGSQFTAAFGAEPLLFRLAGQLEVARPWRHRRPAIWAGSH
jgi:amidase